MRTRLIVYILSTLLRQLEPQMLREVIDDMIDKVEDALQDNQIALKAIQLIRDTVGIPDDIGGDED